MLPMSALKIITLLLLISFNLLQAAVETWTSVDGRTLEGKFVVHLPHREEVVIERALDRRQFHIPMAQLIQPDQLQ